MGAGLALFFAAPRALASSAGAFQACAAALATFGATCIACSVHADALPVGLTLPLRVLPGCAVLAALSYRAEALGDAYRRSAALTAGVALAFDVFACWDADACTWASAIALGVGSALLASGVYIGQRLVFAAGALPALLGFAQLFSASVEFERLRNWGALSLLGGALIFAAALLERHGDRLLRGARALKSRLASW
jgi:hypothetical protein